jgi:two-component system cell cycle sensor histidine kinase/response regulator CckA
MSRQLRVLLVEDSEDDALLVLRELGRAGYELDHERVETRDALVAALEQSDWDFVLSDFSLPGFDGVEALRLVRERLPDVPFILVSGAMGEDLAVAAMRAGAQDYILKDSLARLAPAVERELGEAALRRERQELEGKLVRAQRMEALGTLAGGVAHDFNNILTVIRSYAAFLERSVREPESALEDIRGIQKATTRASDLVGQLLAFSRRQIVAPEPLDLSEVVAGLAKMLKRLIGDDVELGLDLEEQPWKVLADRGQVEQIVMNLVVNARDAMPEGGRVSIRTRCVVREDTAGDERPKQVMLEVTDAGVGMDAEVAACIFEPFFTTKEPGRGTGLGLATVYGIVQQAGGEISVDSQPGQGSTFTVYLPRADQTKGTFCPSTLRPAAGGLGGDETILVAENDEALRGVIARALRGHGYQVLEAGDGEAALQVRDAHDDPVHLVVTDLLMPRMDGAELAKRLPEIPALFITGYWDDRFLQDGRLPAGCEYLAKPFTPDTLVRRVRAMLDAARGAV